MRRIAYQRVVREAVQALQVPVGDLPGADWEVLRDVISAELGTVWEAAEWPDVMRVEGRTTDADGVIEYEQSGEEEIGEVTGVWAQNPREQRNAEELDYELTDTGVLVFGYAEVEVFVRYRTRAPELTGAAWDEDTAYGVGEQVYFADEGDGGSEAGDFWECVTITAAGESPVTTAAKWSRVGIPWGFRRYLAWAGAAGWLVADGQQEKGDRARGQAVGFLNVELGKLYRQQGQVKRVTVRTY